MSTYQEVGGTEVRLVMGVRLILSYEPPILKPVGHRNL